MTVLVVAERRKPALVMTVWNGRIGRMERPDHARRRSRRRRKPHLIGPPEVAEFLKGPVLTAPVFHCTSLEWREEIVESGVDLWRNRTAVFGRGFYLSSQPIERSGPGVVRAAVRL